MTEASPTNATPGRWIRFALVMLPLGTILLGIASFGIWQWKKDQAEDRSFKYAMALRRPITPEGIQRHAEIIREALAKPDWNLSIPGYLESTMGAENMGYTVRRLRYQEGKTEKSVVDAELTGRQWVGAVKMVLVVLPEDPSKREVMALALAELLATAHSLTGEPMRFTVRFAVAPDDEAAFKMMRDDMRKYDEHLSTLRLISINTAETIQRLEKVFETIKCGTQVLTSSELKNESQAFEEAKKLREELMVYTP